MARLVTPVSQSVGQLQLFRIDEAELGVLVTADCSYRLPISPPFHVTLLADVEQKVAPQQPHRYWGVITLTLSNTPLYSGQYNVRIS